MSNPEIECVDNIPFVTDVINHPQHYLAGRFGCECITISRHLTFLAGNAFKYLFRHQEKNGVEDLRKAAVYLRWAIEDNTAAVLPDRETVVRQLVGSYVSPHASGPYQALLDIAASDFTRALARVEAAINE